MVAEKGAGAAAWLKAVSVNQNGRKAKAAFLSAATGSEPMSQ